MTTRTAVSAPALGPGRTGTLTLALVGDIMLGRHVGAQLAAARDDPKRACERVWGSALPLLRGGLAAPGAAQLNAGNLETAITDRTEKYPDKVFNYRAPPVAAEALRAAEWRFVSLANNHSMDFMSEGMWDTIASLQRSGIACAGGGASREEAQAHAVVEAGGWRVAFLSYSDHPEDWAAGTNRPGINIIDPVRFDRGALEAAISRAQQDSHAVVVLVHWGPNWRWRPSKAIRKLGRAFIEAGATCVLGHSAHHIQGIELHLGRPIIYSPGAAVDDYALDGHFRNDLGLLVALDLAQPPAPFQTPPELFPLGPVGKWRGGESAGGDEREAGVEGRSDGSEEDERGEEGRGRGAVVTRLRVVGTHIEHDWGAAGGYPPYELRADVAEGRNRDWVLGRVQELSEEMGTRLTKGSIKGPWGDVPCLEAAPGSQA